MLRSGIFGKATAVAGIVMGAMMLIPPLPFLGTVPLVLSYIVIVPTAIWDILITRELFLLAQVKAQHQLTQGGSL
jgi:hypothetical protein